jgi:hypothetical protein
VFGWLDRIAEAIFRRGQGLVEVSDRVADERRAAVRTVRDLLTETMENAEDDRERGRDESGRAALAAANRAGSVVHEIDDDAARRLVLEWKARFDSITKGWKKGNASALGMTSGEPGYPEPDWSELKATYAAAVERLGAILRALMEPKK